MEWNKKRVPFFDNTNSALQHIHLTRRKTIFCFFGEHRSIPLRKKQMLLGTSRVTDIALHFLVLQIDIMLIPLNSNHVSH